MIYFNRQKPKKTKLFLYKHNIKLLTNQIFTISFGSKYLILPEISPSSILLNALFNLKKEKRKIHIYIFFKKN